VQLPVPEIGLEKVGNYVDYIVSKTTLIAVE